MSPFINIAAKMITSIRQKASFSSKKINEKVGKSVVVIALILSIIYMFFPSHPFSQSSKLSLTSSNKNWIPYDDEYTNSPTSISHIVFGISSSFQSWSNRKNYIDLWWKPNVTLGFLFLDKSPIELLPWPPISLHPKLYENTSKYKDYDEHGMPYAIQMVLVVAELFMAHDTKNVRWYVMANDDTVLFTSNLVEVLSRYDHKKYLYIGSNSESIFSNFENSFETAFGGAGIALSYPLAKALAQNVDGCIKRYPTLLGSDHILQSCVADLGVSLTQERGFHQIDLHRDISGLLTAHPQTPLVSLHHLDVVEPIFPSKDRYKSVKQLLKAAKIDELRLLQQSICYLKQSNWTFSVSWGYSTHLYEQIIAPSVLHVPIETFSQWMRGVRPPKYMFNTRPPSGNPCDAPHVFFLESVDKNNKDNVFVTSYIRKSPRGLPVCSSSGNHSADHISMIRVLSPMKKFEWVGSRRECCDVIQVAGKNDTTVKIRTCMKDEIIA